MKTSYHRTLDRRDLAIGLMLAFLALPALALLRALWCLFFPL